MTVELSKTDRKLLHLLEIDARKPLSFYAKKLRISRAAVDVRLKSLIKREVITGFHTVLDLSAIGKHYCRVFIRYRKISKRKEETMLEYLKNVKGLGWIVVCEGKWDLTFIMIMDDISDIYNNVLDVLTKNHEIISNKEVSMLIQLHHFNHNYLYEEKDHIHLKFSRNKYNIDKTDEHVLKYLCMDSRTPALEIAKKLGVSANTVKNRIKRMLKEKVILAFRPSINATSMGLNHYKVFLEMEQTEKKQYDAVMNYLSGTSEVIYISQTLDGSDLEFEIVLKSHGELNKFMRSFRSMFFKVVKEYRTILHLSEPMINYMP